MTYRQSPIMVSVPTGELDRSPLAALAAAAADPRLSHGAFRALVSMWLRADPNGVYHGTASTIGKRLGCDPSRGRQLVRELTARGYVDNRPGPGYRVIHNPAGIPTSQARAVAGLTRARAGAGLTEAGAGLTEAGAIHPLTHPLTGVGGGARPISDGRRPPQKDPRKPCPVCDSTGWVTVGPRVSDRCPACNTRAVAP